MSNWSSYEIEKKLRRIMGKEYYQANPYHHLGRPFLSGYQLAIEFDKLYHGDVVSMGYIIGGRGANVKISLAQYFARELSSKIKNGIITDVKGIFFSNTELQEVEFKGGIISSSTGGQYDLALFGLIDNTILIREALNDGFNNQDLVSMFGVAEEEVENVRYSLGIYKDKLL